MPKIDRSVPCTVINVAAVIITIDATESISIYYTFAHFTRPFTYCVVGGKTSVLLLVLTYFIVQRLSSKSELAVGNWADAKTNTDTIRFNSQIINNYGLDSAALSSRLRYTAALD